MKIQHIFILFFVALMSLPVFAQDDLPSFDELPQEEWSLLLAGGDTVCSNGTPYAFFVRPADPDKLMVHMQGGGACWNDANCDFQGGESTYDPFTDSFDNPAILSGIFDYDNAENPFQDYTTVLVTYCTGDTHIGNAATDYENNGREYTIQHRGYANTLAVLDWTFANVQAPDSVVMTGCSAGAVPSPVYVPFLAEAYPDARIEHMGDAAGAYRVPGVFPTFASWDSASIMPPQMNVSSNQDLTMHGIYRAAAQALPDVTFTQVDAAYDETQAFFQGLLGADPELSVYDTLQANHEDIRSTGVDNFRAYIAPGESHCITIQDAFYEVEVDGVRLVDWVADLVAGEAIDDITCTDCRD